MARFASGGHSAARAAFTAAAALTLGAFLSVPAIANETATTPGHAHGKKVFPTTASAKAQARHEAGGTTAGSGKLTYGGGVDGIGVTTGPERVYLVFWGSQWGTAGTDANGNTTLSGDSKAEAPRLQQLFKGIGTNNETWSGVMTQYCEGVAAGSTTCPAGAAHVGYPTGGALAGVGVEKSIAAPSRPPGHQLAAEAVPAAGHFGNTSASSNRNAQYVIISPSGTHPDGFNTLTATWCAWHDWNGDTTLTGGAAASSYGDVAFTNLPYLTDMGSSCGQNYVNAGTAGGPAGGAAAGGPGSSQTIPHTNPPVGGAA